MSLSTLSINRPVLAIVMNLIILIFGYIGYTSLGVREFPAIDPPVVTIRTNYTGANAEIIESQITEPLEKAINGIEGIRNISSASNLGNSIITVEFSLDSDLEAASNDVRDKVSQAVRNLPNDIDGPPVVQKSDASGDPIIFASMYSESGSIMELNDIGENVIIPRLQTIPGVSNVSLFSNRRYSMRLRLDPVRLAAYQITVAEVKQALDREHLELPSGKIAGDNTELIVKTQGRFSTPDEFNQMIVRDGMGRIVRLSDVGVAELGPESEESGFRVNGAQVSAIGITPQPGANYIAIADEFYLRLEKLKSELPEGFQIFVGLDNTQFVRRSVEEVKETLLIAILLVVLVIYFFFRDWVIAIRPLIDIPVSLVGAFFIMYVAGFSMNVLTLLAIVLATGLVVDDGIVVTENIFKKIEAGMSPREAAIKGSNEILFAVLSTSTTLAVVFLPLLFLEGFVGKLFVEFGMVIAGAVLISAFVSLTLTPVLNAYLVRKDQSHGWMYRVTEPFFVGLDQSYRSSVNRFLDRRWMAIPIMLFVMGFTWYLAKSLPSELAPLEDRAGFRLSSTLPEGTAYHYTDDFMARLGQLVLDSIPEAEVIVSVTAPGFTGTGGMNTGFTRIRLSDTEKRKMTQQQIVGKAMRLARNMPEARIIPIQEQTISVGLSARFGLPVQYVIQAPDFARLKEVLPKFMEQARQNPVFQQVDVNLKFNRPELNLTIDREKARSLGIKVADVAQTLQLAVSGVRWAYFTQNGKQYQVIGQVERSNRDEPADLSQLYVKNAQGTMIRLDQIVRFEETTSPPQLYHFNRYMSATVSASLAEGKTIGDGLTAMDTIAAQVLDDRFSTDVSGPSRDYRESSSNIAFTFGLALLLIFLVLAAQFESFTDPLIIMFTVPLAVGGAVFSLWYFNLTLNIFSQIGILMLVGLVTKNGILIVEFANQLHEQGMNKSEAIREASAARLRPILMTTLATTLGALPIALALGAGAQSRIPMGVVIVGGLLLSLVLTLYIIPAMYSYLSRRK
jgi:multidrug efflux pump